MPQFDLAGARQAGYSDDEIADKLGQLAGFNTPAARQAGYQSTQIIDRIMNGGQPPAPTAPAAPRLSEADIKAAQPDDPGVVGSAIIGAGRTFDRIWKGGQQGYLNLKDMVNGPDVTSLVTGKTQAQQQLADLKTSAEDNDKAYKTLTDRRPYSTAIGESLPSMVVPLGATATTLGTVAKLGIAAAVPEALSYGTAEERTKRAAGAGIGAGVGSVVIPKVLGAVGNVASTALKSLVGKVSPEVMALAAKAEAAGIPVNLAQLSDSKFLKTLASSLEQMPFTGAAEKTAQQRAAFTRNVAAQTGTDAEKMTPAVYNAQKETLGKTFDDLSMRNSLNVTEELMNRMQMIRDEVSQFGNKESQTAVDNALNRMLNQSTAAAEGKAGVAFELPGAAYSSLDSELSKIIKAGGEKGMYLKTVRDTLRDGMDQSISSTDKAAWDTARSQYKNLKAVRDIVARDGSDGSIPPTQLMQSLTSTEAGKEAMAMDTRGTMGDLARIGQRFVRDTVPNSGTAQRAIAMGLIGGGGFAFGASPTEVAGMLAGGATAGRLMTKVLNSPQLAAKLSQEGLSLTEFMKLPPERITQIIGGLAGMATAENKMRN